MGGSKQRGPSDAEKRRIAAAEQARKEAEELKKKEEEERLALARGIRGKRSLLSEAGGSLGFPAQLGG
jgi:hypothetical protein